YEANNISLTDRCKQLCSPFSISVFVGEDAAKSINETRKTVTTVGYKNVKGWRKHDNILLPTVNRVAVKKSSYITDEKKFPRVKAEPTDTIFEHLSKLATQRGVLLSCTKDGDLLIDKFNPQSDIVGTIEEGVSPLAESYELKISGRDRFATYRVKVKSSSSKKAAYIQEATDPRIVAPRVILMDADDAIPGEAKDAAIWKRNKKAADALSFPFDVTSWYAPNGTLWRPNTRLTIISETMGIKNGFTFLITKVVYKFEKSGSTASITLVPPTVYSNGDIEEPW
ncbi:MAG: phage baseplate assembly protein, partial [Spirochaetota bacterium]